MEKQWLAHRGNDWDQMNGVAGTSAMKSTAPVTANTVGGGKGVIARILTSLIGRQNVCGPTLNSLGGEFGLAPLIGKALAIISDARFVNKNGNIVVERLLSISGEDTLTINRKYRDQWSGKLPCRLHVISNELPQLGDASTAIVGRIVLLQLSNSWLGREDHGLESALQGELAGILNWALAGLQRLTVENGNRFTRLASADEAITTMRDLARPVAAFVREKCETGPDREITVDELYVGYRVWCDDSGHVKAKSRPSAAISAQPLRASRSNDLATSKAGSGSIAASPCGRLADPLSPVWSARSAVRANVGWTQ